VVDRSGSKASARERPTGRPSTAVPATRSTVTQTDLAGEVRVDLLSGEGVCARGVARDDPDADSDSTSIVVAKP
jgi:hypothetical protein